MTTPLSWMGTLHLHHGSYRMRIATVRVEFLQILVIRHNGKAQPVLTRRMKRRNLFICKCLNMAHLLLLEKAIQANVPAYQNGTTTTKLNVSCRKKVERSRITSSLYKNDRTVLCFKLFRGKSECDLDYFLSHVFFEVTVFLKRRRSFVLPQFFYTSTEMLW